jgi:hypothetical protein
MPIGSLRQNILANSQGDEERIRFVHPPRAITAPVGTPTLVELARGYRVVVIDAVDVSPMRDQR